MKTLYMDIETSPNVGHIWSLWNQNISLAQLQQSTEMLCFAAKWRGVKKTQFYAGDYAPGGDSYAMVAALHELLDEADLVVHYNGRRFDVPHANREFKERGFAPPSPFKQLDLLDTIKKQFRLPSNKLAYVSEWLGLEGKVAHEGHELWVKCLAGDPKAWKSMATYNKRDVTLLPEMHDDLMPWLVGAPNVALLDGLEGDRCPNCGGDDLRREGYAFTQLGKFQRYQCRGCGTWSRSGKRVASIDLRAVSA